MINRNMIVRRLVALGLLLVAMMGALSARLADLQLVNGADYAVEAERRRFATIPVTAARGEIVDRNGKPLVTNHTGFSIRFDYAFWDKTQQNEVILKLVRLLQASGGEYADTLPISKTMPYTFTYKAGSTEEKKLKKVIKNSKSLDESMDAPALMEALREKYDIPESFSDEEARLVAGVRYEMELSEFSPLNSYLFCGDISIEEVSYIKERGAEFPGVTIAEVPVRQYATTYAAHILGRVGKIYAEEYEQLRKQGYPMNALVGKDGMEKALEPYLRGVDGEQSVETNIDGKITDIIATKPTQPGKNCVLTLDLGLQMVLEDSLAYNVNRIREQGEASRTKRGAGIKGAAAVVIDVRNGEVLGMASYPTYDLANFSRDYNKMLEDPLKPMFNRAISGVYPPGSTFKVATALASLESGTITPTTKITDKGIYMYYAPNYTPRCWLYEEGRGTHGTINVSGALEGSCNYFFYETSRIMGINVLNDYAKKLGLGQKTGIELAGEAAGNLAGPESREESGGDPWQPGETLQAAIGQSEQQFTPLQIANYIATVVNGGTRYRPHLLKSVEEYHYGSTYLTVEPEVLDTIDIKEENYRAIMEGMRKVTEDGTASSVFRNFPVSVGGKTGSAQVSAAKKADAHGVFVAFAPYENPEIAICVIGENAGSGNSVAPVAKDVFSYYFGIGEPEQAVGETDVQTPAGSGQGASGTQRQTPPTGETAQGDAPAAGQVAPAEPAAPEQTSPAVQPPAERAPPVTAPEGQTQDPPARPAPGDGGQPPAENGGGAPDETADG